VSRKDAGTFNLLLNSPAGCHSGEHNWKHIPASSPFGADAVSPRFITRYKSTEHEQSKEGKIYSQRDGGWGLPQLLLALLLAELTPAMACVHPPPLRDSALQKGGKAVRARAKPCPQ